MSTQIIGHEPAMPVVELPKLTGVYYGLTIRQYYAGLAMQALLSQHVEFAEETDIEEYSMEPVYKGRFLYPNAENDYEYMAKDACKAADALIAELNKTKTI